MEKQWSSVKFDEQNYGENIGEKNLEEDDRRVMRLMTDVKRRELERDRI